MVKVKIFSKELMLAWGKFMPKENEAIYFNGLKKQKLIMASLLFHLSLHRIKKEIVDIVIIFLLIILAE